MMFYRLVCLIQDDTDAFTVSICRTETVEELKQQIHQKKSALQQFKASDLKLFNGRQPEELYAL